MNVANTYNNDNWEGIGGWGHKWELLCPRCLAKYERQSRVIYRSQICDACLAKIARANKERGSK
jgi:hypothetical protein